MSKILIIGDVHGEETWKNCGDIQAVIDGAAPTYCQYIFTGDYVDSYWVRANRMADVLTEIINFKDANASLVTLLWGNHDLQYYYGYDCPFPINNIRPELIQDLQPIYEANVDKFQAAYNADNKYLITHAGVTRKWAENVGLTSGLDVFTLAGWLNYYWDAPAMFMVGTNFAGDYEWGSPYFNDKRKMDEYPYLGVDQVMGHNAAFERELIINQKETMFFVDILQHQGEEWQKPMRWIKGLEIESTDCGANGVGETDTGVLGGMEPEGGVGDSIGQSDEEIEEPEPPDGPE